MCKIKKLLNWFQAKKWFEQVLENHFSNFINDDSEWKGDEIVFDIPAKKEKKTQLQFTQIGLTPVDECYNVCFDAWTSFITNSLDKLIKNWQR